MGFRENAQGVGGVQLEIPKNVGIDFIVASGKLLKGGEGGGVVQF